MKQSLATITREFGPFGPTGHVHGVTFDGKHVWIATGDAIEAVDPATGAVVRRIAVLADAGTAFDGRYLYQIGEGRIQKIDPETGKVLSAIASPEGKENSGLAWAEGSLWVANYEGRKIHQIDPETGKVLRTITSNRYVTGVTWVDGELWHGTWEGGSGELRHIDAGTGDVLEQLDMPEGVGVAGLEYDGAGLFYCGGGNSGKLRVVRRPVDTLAARKAADAVHQ
ncbi:PQQ-binding-like beta-propeller repeat protein [Pusillimonas sp. TS35]|uniref:Vgb family protein n=1 Tax=Paracandidimonas lactea TaxID=2895524 RepID=UPI0013686E1D|nr:PQQ-binding-like beta-propeller repeat protein [Paracandidimonas lactea]MYN12566.1 PQQ-binding-like beta-propeller repeat protein [Pusillimonas sp. TS35]